MPTLTNKTTTIPNRPHFYHYWSGEDYRKIDYLNVEPIDVGTFPKRLNSLYTSHLSNPLLRHIGIKIAADQHRDVFEKVTDTYHVPNYELTERLKNIEDYIPHLNTSAGILFRGLADDQVDIQALRVLFENSTKPLVKVLGIFHQEALKINKAMASDIYRQALMLEFPSVIYADFDAAEAMRTPVSRKSEFKHYNDTDRLSLDLEEMVKRVLSDQSCGIGRPLSIKNFHGMNNDVLVSKPSDHFVVKLLGLRMVTNLLVAFGRPENLRIREFAHHEKQVEILASFHQYYMEESINHFVLQHYTRPDFFQLVEEKLTQMRSVLHDWGVDSLAECMRRNLELSQQVARSDDGRLSPRNKMKHFVIATTGSGVLLQVNFLMQQSFGQTPLASTPPSKELFGQNAQSLEAVVCANEWLPQVTEKSENVPENTGLSCNIL